MNKYLPSVYDFDSEMSSDNTDHKNFLFFNKNHLAISKTFNYSPKASRYIGKVLLSANTANNALKAILDVIIEQAYEVLLFKMAIKLFPQINDGKNHKIDCANFMQKFNFRKDLTNIKNMMAFQPCFVLFYFMLALVYLSLKFSFVTFKILTTLTTLLISSILLAIDLVSHLIVNIPKFAQYCENKKNESSRQAALNNAITGVNEKTTQNQSEPRNNC